MTLRFDRLDLNLLRVLLEIDRARSVTDAGRRLALSQPATSNALARLREAFGDPLFVRGAGGLTPTALAERIVPAAARHLEALEAALTGAEVFDPSESVVEWRLSLSDLGEAVFLPRIVEAVLREAPHTRFVNVGVPAERVADALARREVGLAIGMMDPGQAGVRSKLLFSEHYVVLGSQDAPPAWRTRRGFGDARLVLASPAATYHRGVADALERHGLADRVAVRARHYASVPDLVVEGRLAAIVPSMFARMACQRSRRLAMWPLPLKMPPYEVRMVWHAASDADAAQGWLRERVLKLFGRERARTHAR